MAKVSILEAIAAASENDLKEIDAEIASIEKKLAALRAARSVLSVAVHGPKQRAAPVPRQAKGSSDGQPVKDEAATLAAKIYDLISAEGPMPIGEIATRLGKSPQGVALSATKSGWFAKTSVGDLAIKKTG